MKKEDDLFHLPSIAATLGSVLAETVGCAVRFMAGIRTASTNGSLVNLPIFAQVGDKAAAAILRCFLAHEILGHVLHTDFKVLQKWVKETNPSKTARSIQNIICDGRIERAAWTKMAQVRRILHEGVEALKAKGFFGPDVPEEGRAKAAVVTGMLLRVIRKEHLKQNLATEGWIKAGEKHLGVDVCKKVIRIAMRGAESKSTKSVIQATEDIMEILRKQDEEQPKDKPEEKSKDKSKGDGTPDDSSEESDSDDSSADIDPGKADPKDSASTDSDNSDTDDSDEETDDTGSHGELDEAEAVDTDIADGAVDILDPSCQNAPSLGEKPTNRGYSGDIKVDVINPAAMDRFIPSSDSFAVSQKLAAKLEALLESVSDEGDKIEDEGRLSGAHLTNAVLGDPYIFTVSGEEKEGLSTAISVMVDQSGSMSSGQKLASALTTSYALSQALSRFEGQGIRFELTAFDDVQSIIKPFNKSFASSKNGLSSIVARGGTSFLDSVMAVSKRLAVQPERRKVAFFVTDGDIGSDPKLVFKTLMQQGIEVRVVFLVSHGQGEYAERVAKEANIKHWSYAMDSNGIPSAVFKALKGTFVQ